MASESSQSSSSIGAEGAPPALDLSDAVLLDHFLVMLR
jgi:hypothetical protein